MISKSLIKTLTQPPHWIDRPNDTNEIILGTVGRLVRNISGCVFPGWSTEEQRREVAEKVVPAIRKLPGQKAAYDLPMEEIPYELRRLMRLHRRLSAVMSARGAGCHLICNPNRDEVFMVNEEEHIAYHCFRPGNDMPRVLRRIRETAGKLDKALPIARNESRGGADLLPGGLRGRHGLLLHPAPAGTGHRGLHAAGRSRRRAAGLGHLPILPHAPQPELRLRYLHPLLGHEPLGPYG